MELLFLTGMSGAGKSAAVRYLEDCGYFCMDNVPPYVLPDLVKSFFRGRNGEGFSTPKLAFVVDIRSQEYLDGFDEALVECIGIAVVGHIELIEERLVILEFETARLQQFVAEIMGTSV